MADKDNANPIVYAQSSNPVGRGTDNEDEWWRDASMGRSKMATALTGASSRWAGRDGDSGYGSVDEEDEDEKEAGDPEMKEAQSDSTMKKEKEDKAEPIDSQEVFDLIRSISDPEHPLTLEQLAVVNASHITVTPADAEAHQAPHILLEFTPTIPHCSMATLIGLALRVRLLRALPTRYKVDIRVRPGTHQSERAVNKQLNDKERVAAALENQHLLGVVSDCLATAGRRGASEEEALKRADDLALELGIAS